MTWLTKADTICHSNEWLIRRGNSRKYHFSKIQVLTFTLSRNLSHTDLLETSVRAGCNKTCQREGKGWGQGMVFTHLWQFFVRETAARKAQSQPFRTSGQKFFRYKSLPCCQPFWGLGQMIYPRYLTFPISTMRIRPLIYVIRFLWQFIN